MLAGATTVGVGTALFYDPLVCGKINAGIVEYLDAHRLASVTELIGGLGSKQRTSEPWSCVAG